MPNRGVSTCWGKGEGCWCCSKAWRASWARTEVVVPRLQLFFWHVCGPFKQKKKAFSRKKPLQSSCCFPGLSPRCWLQPLTLELAKI